MPTVRLGTSSPAVKTKKNDTVTWELASPTTLAKGQYLRVEVKSPFLETIGDRGKDEESKVDLKMSFHDGTDKDVPLTYSLYLVTPGSPPSEVQVTDPGPSLVIDTIGPPTPPSCQEDEDEPVEADYSYEEQH